MRLLRIIPSMERSFGGPCQGIRNSIPAMRAHGIACEVVCADDPASPSLLNESFAVHALGPSKLGGYYFAQQMLPWLDANIDRFDAVIAHTLWQWSSTMVLAAFKKRDLLGRPSPTLFVMPHGALDPWYQKDPSRRLKALRNIVHWSLVERALIGRADCVLFTTAEEQLLARTTFPGYKPKSEACVYYGIPPAPHYTPGMRRAFQAALPLLSNDSTYLLYLGRMHEKKGVEWLVEAYAEATEHGVRGRRVPVLVLAGPGRESAYGQRVQNLVRRLGCADRVLFSGMLEGDAKWGALYGCEALVMCSHQENFGISIVEALSCDRPVLITDKVNICREVQSGGGGWVCEQDRSSFASLLKKWIKGSAASAALTPRHCYEEHFGIGRHAEVFASVVRSVVMRKHES